MILHLVGGLSDGEVIDLNDPGSWGWGENELCLPLPEVIEVHSARSNRTAYRLVRATPDECVYQIDPSLTAIYRRRDRPKGQPLR